MQKIKESFERQFFIIQTHKMADVTVSEERLKTLMEEISNENSKSSSEYLSTISSNFDITMAEIKKVSSDIINEVKSSLEHTETVLEEKVARAEIKIEQIKEQINEAWNYQANVEVTGISLCVALVRPYSV